MTDIVEEARAMLARLNEGAFAWGNAHANQQGERLLAALADECERLRKQNSEYHRRAQVAEAAVLEETTRGHRLGHSVGRSLANAAASTAMRECERLRAENARLREAMRLARKLVSDVDASGGLGYGNHEDLHEALDALDAAKEVR